MSSKAIPLCNPLMMYAMRAWKSAKFLGVETPSVWNLISTCATRWSTPSHPPYFLQVSFAFKTKADEELKL